MRKPLSIIISVALACSMLLGSTVSASAEYIAETQPKAQAVNPYEVNAVGTTYYVDAQNGSDTNDGTADNKAWQTIGKISATTFNPGDVILLKRGCEWTGETLTVHGSGNEANDITIDAYGEGAKPLIVSPLGKSAFILLDESYWTIQNIAAQATAQAGSTWTDQNKDAKVAPTFWFDYKTKVVKNITVRNCEASGSANICGGYGMDFGGYKPEFINNVRNPATAYNFENILIEGCYVHDSSVGIFVRGNEEDVAAGLGRNKNVIIRDTYITRVNDSGIFMFNTDGGLIERCRYSDGLRTYWGTVGIWHANVTGVTIQYCESSDCKDTTVDGDSHDNDWGSRNCLNQYNYGHDNLGGFILSMSWPLHKGGQTSGNTVRYNVSRNNAAEEIHVANLLPSPGNKYYNNTFIGGKGKSVMVFRQNYGGTQTDETFFNNIFVSPDPNTIPIYDGIMKNISSNNCWYFPNGLTAGKITYGSSTYNTIEELQAATSSEVGSITTDPKLVSISGLGRSGAKLLKGSPCIDAGVVKEGIEMGSKDYFGNSNLIGSAHEIGAYEGTGEDPFLMDTNIAIPNYDASTSVYAKDGTMYFAENAADNDVNTTWKPFDADGEPWMSINFIDAKTNFDKVVLKEKGNSITSYDVQVLSGGQWMTIKSGDTLGAEGATITGEFKGSKLRLRILSYTGATPEISTFIAYNEANKDPEVTGDKVYNWTFEENGLDGSVINDERGNAHGVLHTAATDPSTIWVEGRTAGKKALLFNAETTYVDFAAKDITSNWTLSTWLKRYDADPNLCSTLLMSTDSSVASAKHVLSLETWEPGGLKRNVGLGWVAQQDNPFHYSAPKEQWVNMTMTFDGTNIKVYENGVLKDSIVAKDGRAGLPLGIMGINPMVPAGESKQGLRAAIDEMSAFKKVLSQQEIVNLYNGKDPILNVKIATEPTKKAYKVGEALDVTGGKLKVTYDGSPAEVINITPDMVTGFDSSRPQTAQVITVTYAGTTLTYTVSIESDGPVVEADKADLTALTAYAKAQKLDPGYVDVVNAVKVALDKAISAADAIIADFNATQEEVNAAYDELLSKVHMLEFKGNLDRLKSLVALTSKVNVQDYIPETLVAFNAALAKARDIIANGNTLQADIETAYIELRDAHMALRLKPNKDKLQSLIDSMNSVNLNNFTAESVAPFSLALSEAIAVNSDPNASQAEVDNATSKLNAKFKALVPVTTDKPVVTPDEDPKVDVVEDNKKPANDKTDTTVPTTADTTAPLLPIAIIASMAALVLFRKRRED